MAPFFLTDCVSKKSDSPLKEKPLLKISSQHFLWCPICNSDVRLFERFYVEENVRHRNCFVCQRCKKRLHVGLYRTTKDGDGYECLEHEKDDLLKKLSETELKPAPVGEDDKENYALVSVQKEPACETNGGVSEKSPNTLVSEQITAPASSDECPQTEPEPSSIYPQISSAEKQLEISFH